MHRGWSRSIGVHGVKTKSNNIMEMARVLGIEAARQTIYNEIQDVMKLYGLNIDPRHVYLLADQMTCKVSFSEDGVV
jgi:DNA-directed RNA polymerase III subunit RPC1